MGEKDVTPIDESNPDSSTDDDDDEEGDVSNRGSSFTSAFRLPVRSSHGRKSFSLTHGIRVIFLLLDSPELGWTISQ